MSQIIQDFNLILAERKLENERFKQDSKMNHGNYQFFTQILECRVSRESNKY